MIIGIIFLTSLVVVSFTSLLGYTHQRSGNTESIDRVVAEDIDHTEFMEEFVFRIDP